MVSAWGHTGRDLAENSTLLAAIGAFCLSLEQPWIVAWDANLTPEQIVESGWVSRVAGRMVRTRETTCRASNGEDHELDFFITSRHFPRARAQKIVDASSGRTIRSN